MSVVVHRPLSFDARIHGIGEVLCILQQSWKLLFVDQSNRMALKI